MGFLIFLGIILVLVYFAAQINYLVELSYQFDKSYNEISWGPFTLTMLVMFPFGWIYWIIKLCSTAANTAARFAADHDRNISPVRKKK